MSSSSSHSHPSSGGPGCISGISHSSSSALPKDEPSTKVEKWMERIDSVQIPRAEVNKLIMDYLVTEGFKDAAEKFQVESGTNPGLPLDTLDQRIKILELIQTGEIQEAVEMINSYQPSLLDDNRYLYFHLQQQHLIELIRNRNIDDALKFAQDNLADQGEENSAVLEELERTLALLAFEDPETSPFGDLLALSHRQKVASELNTAFLGAQDTDSSVSKLAYILKFILWAQEELDHKKFLYPKMTDLATATIEEN